MLDPEVVALAKQRLGEGQYESSSKFAKLVDKVHFYFLLSFCIHLVTYLVYTETEAVRGDAQSALGDEGGASPTHTAESFTISERVQSGAGITEDPQGCNDVPAASS